MKEDVLTLERFKVSYYEVILGIINKVDFSNECHQSPILKIMNHFS